MRSLIVGLAALGLWTLFSDRGASQNPPPAEKKLNAEQQARLKERDRWEAEVRRLQAADKLDEASAAAQKMLAIEREVFGPNHEEIANSISWLGSIAEDRLDFAAARGYRQEALAMRVRLHGKDHWRTVNARLELQEVDLLAIMTPPNRKLLAEIPKQNANAVSLYKAGKYREAIAIFQQVVEIRKKVQRENHPDYAESLTNLAWLYYFLGDHAKAEPLFRQALGIRRKVLGENHPHCATSMQDLGFLYYRLQGDHAKAEPLLRKALEIRRSVLGENNIAYAESLKGLAQLYLSLGAYAKAEPLYRQAMETVKKLFGENRTEFVQCLIDLGAIYAAEKDYAKTEQLFRQALMIHKKLVGEKHPDYAKDLDLLAWLYMVQRDYAKAEPLLVQSLEIRKMAMGEKHPRYADGLQDLGLSYQLRRDYAKAEPLLRQAMEIRKEALGESNPAYAESLSNFAKLYHSQGDDTKAESLAQHSLCITRDLLDASAVIQADRQQLLAADRMRDRLDDYLSISLNAQTPPEKIAPFLLQAKGAIFVRQRRQRQIVALAANDSEAANCARGLDRVSRRLATLAGVTPKPEQREIWRKQLAEMTEQRERLEAELSGLSTAFRTRKAHERLTPEQLRDRIPADTVLVDLLEFWHSAPDSNKNAILKFERRLLAMILQKGQPITLVQLGSAQVIADAIDQWRLTTRRTQSVLDDNDPALVLRQKLWEPIAKHIASAKTVLISPDGATARLPFAALPGSKPGSYLIEEIQIAVLPVPQLLAEILEHKPTDAPSDPSLLVVGAVDYDAVPGKTVLAASSASAMRDGAAKKWWPLDATRAEIVAIKDSFEQRFPDGKVRMLRGAGATEEAVREQAPTYRWIHIATHGFFSPPTAKALGQSGDDRNRDGIGFADREATGWNPGLLSGLALAGANREPTPDRDDGILTALEVQALDLSKVEMVVLSACETGLGKVAGGEGILGLQRAFQVAGVRTTVTSMWSVDDKATQQLMVRFYENRWEKKLPALEALVEAQRWMLVEGVSRGMVKLGERPKDGLPLRTPPLFWAAFVLSGDWR